MSIAKDVRIYLRNKPYMMEALERDIVNLSKMARTIKEDLGVDSESAIKAALIRFSGEFRKNKHKREEKIMRYLQNSKISVWDNVSLLISDEHLEIESKAKVEIKPYYIYIVDKRVFEGKKEKIKSNLIKSFEDCSVLNLSSPKEIEKVPGFLAFLLSIISEQDINIIEFFSCYAETIIVVERFDVLKAYEVLYGLVK